MRQHNATSLLGNLTDVTLANINFRNVSLEAAWPQNGEVVAFSALTYHARNVTVTNVTFCDVALASEDQPPGVRYGYMSVIAHASQDITLKTVVFQNVSVRCGRLSAASVVGIWHEGRARLKNVLLNMSVGACRARYLTGLFTRAEGGATVIKRTGVVVAFRTRPADVQYATFVQHAENMTVADSYAQLAFRDGPPPEGQPLFLLAGNLSWLRYQNFYAAVQGAAAGVLHLCLAPLPVAAQSRGLFIVVENGSAIDVCGAEAARFIARRDCAREMRTFDFVDRWTVDNDGLPRLVDKRHCKNIGARCGDTGTCVLDAARLMHRCVAPDSEYVYLPRYGRHYVDYCVGRP